ncbi:MAG: enoyl-CoA hydratase/isomerase family protein [Myxococcota bacterium]
MSPAARAESLSLADAVERLRPPRSLEAWSPVRGCALWIVDLRGDAGELGDTLAEVVFERLSGLPCPVVGRVGATAGSRFAAAFAGRCDALAESDLEAEALRSGVEANPLAAFALVHLLRHGESRSVEAGLLAESTAYSTLQSGPEFRRWLEGRAARRSSPPEGEGPAVLTRRTGSMLEILLNRPQRHNAFSVSLRDGLVEALELARSDPGLERLVLRGRGPSFCSGGDLSEFGTLPDPATAHAIRMTRSPARLLAGLSDRLWAQLHGSCIGAGIELPAFAAHITARPGACFELPELTLGLVPGAGGTISLPRRIGRQRTGWLALSGTSLDVERALAWGLVDELVAADAPLPSAD